MHNTRSSQSIIVMQYYRFIGKSDLIDIDCINQSIEIYGILVLKFWVTLVMDIDFETNC